MRLLVPAILVMGLPLAAYGSAGSATTYRGPSCPEGSYEGAFTKQDMVQFYNCVIPFVDEFTNNTYTNMPPPTYLYIDFGESVNACGDVLTDMAYGYCPLDETVYLGLRRMWKLYNRLGDAAPVAGLAHELGHHYQAQAGVPEPTTNRENVPLENQADCVAGAWIAFADQQGSLEAEDDLADIDRLLKAIASAEGPERDHGTLEERAVSFQLGLDEGMVACNGFLPNTPILTAG